MAQGPNYGLQGGSTWTVGASGTLVIGSGGSVQVESGGVINIAAGGSLTGNGVSLTSPVFNSITLGGTVMRAAFGTSTLTSGVGTIATGMTRVLSANANTVLGEASGNGSHTSTHVDLSLSASGSVIFRAIAGTLPYSANTVIAWSAMGT